MTRSITDMKVSTTVTDLVEKLTKKPLPPSKADIALKEAEYAVGEALHRLDGNEQRTLQAYRRRL